MRNTQLLAALASGRLLAGDARPCPLPEAAAAFAWAPGDEGWANPPRVGGWFEAEPAERVRLPIDTTCGDGNDDWVAARPLAAPARICARPGISRAGPTAIGSRRPGRGLLGSKISGLPAGLGSRTA